MAAGQGFKTFTTGEVLSAADVNGYLMQGVLVFANSAERDSEITSPQEGQFAYLKDTNVTTYYTGSAWANLDTTGMTNPMTTTGDTIYSSSGSTPARLGIGSTGNVLTVAGGVPTWAAPAAGGGFTSIASGSLSGSATTLSSISGSYKNLRLIIKGAKANTDYEMIRCRANNDTTADYHQQAGNYSVSTTYAATSAKQATSWELFESYSGTSNGIFIVDFFDYANTTTGKLVQIRWQGGSGPSNYYGFYYGRYKDSAAITRLDILAASGFTAGTYTLYGEN